MAIDLQSAAEQVGRGQTLSVDAAKPVATNAPSGAPVAALRPQTPEPVSDVATVADVVAEVSRRAPAVPSDPITQVMRQLVGEPAAEPTTPEPSVQQDVYTQRLEALQQQMAAQQQQLAAAQQQIQQRAQTPPVVQPDPTLARRETLKKAGIDDELMPMFEAHAEYVAEPLRKQIAQLQGQVAQQLSQTNNYLHQQQRTAELREAMSHAKVDPSAYDQVARIANHDRVTAAEAVSRFQREQRSYTQAQLNAIREQNQRAEAQRRAQGPTMVSGEQLLGKKTVQFKDVDELAALGGALYQASLQHQIKS